MDMAGRISRQLGPAGDMYVVGAPYSLSKRTSLYDDVDYARYSDALANSPAEPWLVVPSLACPAPVLREPVSRLA